MLRKLWARWRAAGWGLLSQALTLVATFLPVVWGVGDALVILVVSTAVSTVLTPFATLAAQYRLPISDSAGQLSMRTLVSALFALGTAAVVGMAIWLGGSVVNIDDASGWALAIGLLTLTQCAFTIVVALLIRVNSYPALMHSRLAYGFGTFGFTVAALLLGGGGLHLVAAVAGGYLVGSLTGFALILRRARKHAMGRPALALRGGGRYAWESRTLAVSGAIGALAGQIGAIATPLLGPLSVPWAAVVRTTSGFQTVGVVVVGSAIDSEFARAIRNREHRAALTVVRRANMLGLALAVPAAAAAVAAGAFTTSTAFEPLWIIAIAIVAYAGANTALAPIGRLLGLAGSPRLRLLWDVARCVGFGASLFVPSPWAIVLSFGLCSALALASYVLLVRRAMARASE